MVSYLEKALSQIDSIFVIYSAPCFLKAINSRLFSTADVKRLALCANVSETPKVDPIDWTA
jgi:hypothetical protein